MNIQVNEIEQMVFVATLPRSGSSMDCGILERCGAFGGLTIGAVPANPKGIYENQGVNGLALAPILKDIGIRTPRGLLTLHKAGGAPKEMFAHFTEDMTYALNRQGYKAGVAYYKNGIFTFLFDRINECFPEAVWLLPSRNIEKVVKSTRNLGQNRTDETIVEEIDDYLAMYAHIQQAIPERVHLINNDAIVAGDFAQIKAVVEALGLAWNQKAVEEWIDPAMWTETAGAQKPVRPAQRDSGNNRG